jgi:hypothetical protein
MTKKRHVVGRGKRRAQIAAARPDAKPEDILFDWWTEARLKRDTTKDPKIRQKYYEQADRLQHALEDTGPLGHRMVWGSEYAKDRDEGYSAEALKPYKPALFASRYGGRY